MKKTIVVVGGGYAGLHTIGSVRKAWGREIGRSVRLILLDQNPYHFKKVLLVKAPIHADELRVPFKDYCWNNVELLQGELLSISKEKQVIHYKSPDNLEKTLAYDQLVLAVGSVMTEKDEVQGGIVLQGEYAVKQIQQELEALTFRAQQTNNLAERKKILHATVVGGGITGIEIAAEIAAYLRRKGTQLGITTHFESVRLIHSRDQLIAEAASKVGYRLERRLHKLGVKVIKNMRALQFSDGIVTLSNGKIATGLCLWTLGTRPNPIVQRLELPNHSDGRLLVDESYRVQGTTGIYAIGDCARVTDPKTGTVDGMNCKEAVMQAKRLGKIMKADVQNVPAPTHGNIVKDGYCVALGPDDGLLWAKRFGKDWIITGKIARKAKVYAWKISSTVK